MLLPFKDKLILVYRIRLYAKLTGDNKKKTNSEHIEQSKLYNIIVGS